MKTIWKFELTPNRIQSIPLPFGAQILTVQTKGNDAPLLWVLVDPDLPPQERHLGIYTTNTAVPDDPGRYVGTFLIYEGSLEFHLFEMAGPPDARGSVKKGLDRLRKKPRSGSGRPGSGAADGARSSGTGSTFPSPSPCESDPPPSRHG